MPPPPLPIVRTASLAARIRDDHLVIEPVAKAPIFAELERVSGGKYQSLWLATAAIYSLEVVAPGGGSALLALSGLFRRHSTYPGDRHDARWVGPLAAEEAELARAKIGAALGLPREVASVDEATLARDAAAFHGRWVSVEATWSTGLESSAVAGLWFEPPGPYAYHQHGASRRRIVGRVSVAQGGRGGGYGHMGMWGGVIEAVSMSPPAHVKHDEVR